MVGGRPHPATLEGEPRQCISLGMETGGLVRPSFPPSLAITRKPSMRSYTWCVKPSKRSQFTVCSDSIAAIDWVAVDGTGPGQRFAAAMVEVDE